MADAIFREVLKAITYLFIAYVAFLAWHLARGAAVRSSRFKVLLQGFLWCLAISLFASINLGSHTESEDDDPLYGRTERVQDYEPTFQQQVGNFCYFMTLLYIPVVLGALASKKDKRATISPE